MADSKRLEDVCRAGGDVALGMIGMFGRMASEFVDARRKRKLEDRAGDFWVYAAHAWERGLHDARETAQLVRDDLSDRRRRVRLGEQTKKGRTVMKIKIVKKPSTEQSKKIAIVGGY